LKIDLKKENNSTLYYSFHFKIDFVMMKKFLFALLFISNFSLGQNPLVKQWDYRFGGMQGDYLTSMRQTKDGGYILGGYSYSGVGGDKTQTVWGSDDYWIVKTDSLGNKLWDQGYGGTGDDQLYYLQQTTDGGYILGGYSFSGIGGDKSEANWGGNDYWIVKTDSLGVMQWDKDFGGTDYDYLSSVQQTADGGYILGGLSASGISGNKTLANWGYFDYWIVKIDSLGNVQWDRDFGGTDDDELYSLQQTADNGYILGGYSISVISGDKTELGCGNGDYWVVKTDSLGVKQWDKDFGGGDIDALYSLLQTADGGYILAGSSSSSANCDKTQGTWGDLDYWIVKTDSFGNKLWDKDFGATADEELSNISQTADGGYLLSGDSYSTIGGDKTEDNLGLEQTWVVKTDSLGNKQWDKTLRTNGHDETASAIQINDSCYAIGNLTDGAIGGDKTQDAWSNSRDYWLIKFCDTTSTTQQLPHSAFTSSANNGCANSCFDFTNASLNATTYQWFFTGGNPASSTQQNPSNICYANPGVYDVMLIASSNFASDTLVQAAYITIFTLIAVSISQNGNFLTCNPAAASYQWSLNGYQIPGATSQTLFINQTGTFTIEVIDSTGCISSDTLVVNNIPSPNFSTIDTTLCEKFCTDFLDQSTNNPTAWQWIFPGGSPSFSTDQNPTNICYTTPGVYDVTLITTNASGNDTLTLSNYITVYPTPPFPTITQVGYTLTSSAATFYQWQLNSADIPGATNQSYTILQTGYYTVVVGDSNSCKNSTTVYDLISGVDEVDDASISIYPNPSSGSFTVELLNGLPQYCGTGGISIDVVNVIGQKVFSSSESRYIGNSSTFSEGVHSDKKEIDLSDAAPGIYFVEIKTENEYACPDFFGARKKILIAK